MPCLKFMAQVLEDSGIRAKGRHRFYVPHLDGEIEFAYPAKGPDDFSKVRYYLKQDGLRMPTMAQTASLVYAAWQNPKEKFSRKIIDVLKENSLWVNNGFFYMSHKGAYIVDNPERIMNGRPSFGSEDLDIVDILEKNHLKNPFGIRFVPFSPSFEVDLLESSLIAKNPLINALAEEEGAKKLEKIAEKYNSQFFVKGHNGDYSISYGWEEGITALEAFDDHLALYTTLGNTLFGGNGGYRVAFGICDSDKSA